MKSNQLIIILVPIFVHLFAYFNGILGNEEFKTPTKTRNPPNEWSRRKTILTADIKDNRKRTAKILETKTLPISSHLISRQRRDIDCSVLNTCRHSAKKTIPNCYCDDLCSTFNDCCFDYAENGKHNKLLARDKIEKINRTGCYPLSSRNTFDGVRVVDKCDSKFSESNNSCEQTNINTMNDLLLVSGNDGITYRNEHCARCNGIDDFERWTFVVKLYLCPKEASWRDYIDDLGMNMAYHLYQVGCGVQQYPPETHPPRYCLVTGFREDLDWSFVPVTCLDNTMPISSYEEAFGSLSCCIESFPYPDECQQLFTCYESNEEFFTKTEILDTLFMMMFFDFKASKVSLLTYICKSILYVTFRIYYLISAHLSFRL